MFKRKEYKEKQLRYSIRKVSFGAASVAISALYLLMGSAVVSASEVQAVNGDQTTVTNPTVKDNEDKSRIEKHETTTEAANSAVVTLDKTSLTKLIEEIDGKFTSGKYASKTEDSVNKLKIALEAAKTALSTAKTQAELSQAHANLIVATTKLQTKPEEKKEAPAVDTTNGKATVGKKATNTEKASDSNSIANAGSRDERNGKALDANNPFRTGTDAATTDTDPAANQTYTAPAENADLNELKSELLKLPDAVQNNTKIQDMNDLGDQTGVARGDVKEIQEFGGWKAINQPDGTPGKFAIARKTESGIFPVETVNTVFTNIRNGQARYYDTYVGEQAFDRSKDYMLFLGKVRTIASENEQTFNGKPYSRTGLGGSDSYAIKSFSGIEKTFKAHSPETGSKVKVAFKTGFTGDLNGTKAKYLVEVVYRQNNSEVTAYTYTFEPQPRATVKNDKGIVTPAKDGTGRAYVRSEFNNYTLNKAEVEAKMAEEANKPNGQAGTFTSSDIDLPVGVTEYTVRIKVTDTDRMGMGYQSPLRHYALPVTGLDFSVEQDTRKLAKNLLQRVYDKLKATEAQDIKGKTDETISAYKEQLKNVENLLAGDLKNTQEYKDIVTAVLDGQKALRTDKSKLTASNNNLLGLINEDPDPRIGKTPISKEPYNTAKDEAVKAQTEAQTILAQENPNPDVVATAVSKLNEKLAELKAARAELVVAATDAQKTKLEESAAKLVKADTAGKTQESINAYETTYNDLTRELEDAKAKAAAIKTAGDNASRLEALAAQEAVDAVLAKLEAAKATLVDKATEEQKAELAKAEAALTPEEESSLAGTKTPASIAEYKKAVEAIQADLTQAKTTASDLVTKAAQNNAKKADAAEAIAKVDALKAKLANATALLKDKVNTSDLATAKDALKELAKVENVTDGKTTSTKDAYDAAKRDADAAVTAAEGIINNADSTPEQVAEALTNVKAKKAELEKAKAALVDKATDAQKTKLEESAAKLVKADTAGKTQDSINEYETTYNNLKTELDKAIEAAAAIKTAGDNASEHAALKAQEAVDAVQAKLEAAKATLVDKATEEQVAELRKAEAALTPEEESSLAGTKTPASIAEYKKAVEAIQADLTQAKTTASDLVTKAAQNNAKKADAAEAIAKVDALKAKLANATALLKDKVNTSDLATAKDALKELAKVENVTDGKTTSTKDAYDAAKRDADAAVTAAEGIINNADSTPEQVAEALTNVKAKKAELEAAKAALVDKATEAQKTKLEESVAKLTKADTTGKTQESIDAYEATYNNLKTELDKAIEAAAAIKTAGDNASEHAALKAQEAVDAVQAKLEAAKATLVDKATEEQVAELRKAEAALTPEEESSLAGTKTPASIAEYKKAVEAIQADLTQAKTTASDLVTKAAQNNAKKADAAEAIAKVDALKAKLANATALLKDKVNTSDLATAKDALKELAKVENVTDGKTTSTKDAYDAAKRDADAAVAKAEGLIANPNATPEEVAEALTEVNAKKAELEKAKAALVDKITQDQKDDLANAEENLKLADTTGKNEDSIKAYNDEVAKLSDELEAAKKAAKDLVDKGDNAGELEAYRVQAKINKLKSKLAEAAKLLKEIDKSAAKKEVEDAAKKATDAIIANNDLTPEQKEAAKAKVAEEATKAIAAIEKATTEDDVTTAKESGKLGIEKEAAKAEIEAAKAAKEKAIEANTDLTPEQKAAAKAKVAEEATKATAAIDQATTKDGVTTATDAGKLGIEKEAAKAEIEAAKAAKEKAIEANTDLTPEQKAAAKAKVAEEATKATAAIDQATTKDGVTTATDAGKLGIEKEAAKAEIEAAKAAKEKAIDANDKLSDSEKQAAKEEAARVADEAKKAIDVATDSAGVDGAKTTGTTAVEAINPVGKEKALDAIQKATEDKLSEIDRDDKLSDKEKDKAKAEVAKAAIEAVNAINAATDQASVDAKQTEGTKAVSEVNPVGKDKAKAEIEKSLSEKTNAIDANSDLTDEQKAEAKAKIADEAKKAIDAIDKATTTEDVAAAKESGKLAIEKEAAKAEIEAAKAAKEKAIDANPDLTDDEKATAKERVEEEAEAAKNAIDKATELSDIDKVTETGKDDIKKVTVTSAKEEAKKAIDKALEEKEKAIDARTDLTEEEKEAAKKAAREEAEAAKNAIDKATTLEDINKVLEDGKENIAKINPENLKDKAKKAIDEALAAKEKAIDARTDLTEEEKEAAKKAAREEAEAAKNAIDKATTLEDINKVLEDGKENIAKINPENLKDKAKKAIDKALAAKEKAIDARTDLTQEEKEAAKKAAREEAEAAKNAIDKATTSEDINKVLEDGKENIAKINPVGAKEGALAFEGSLQASVTGVVIAERGKAISQADIIAKLNLPENVTVISIDLPDTDTVGRKLAKVTLRLPDGTEATVFVPVEVIESFKEDKQQNNTQENSKPAAEPSKNSEQPAVNQTEDVKENASTTSQETKDSKQIVLPNTGTGNEISIFGSAAMTVLASLGLVATSKKKEEE